MPTKKETRGGARPNAGREKLPPHLRRQVIQPSVLPGTVDRLAALTLIWGDADGPISAGEVIDRALAEAHPEAPDQ